MRIVNIIAVFLLTGCMDFDKDENHNKNKNEHHKYSGKIRNVAFVHPAKGVEKEQYIELSKIFPIKKLPYQALPYHSGTDKQRFKELKKALYGKEKYIWCVRGGYGSARLFEQLCKMKKPENPKVLIGFSDITFLHLFLNKWGWKTIHGAMPMSVRHNPANIEKILHIIKTNKGSLHYDGIVALNDAAKDIKSIQASMIGGNLTLIQTSIGTPWQINPTGKILFLENINEPGYAIDRSLLHLKQAGILKGVVAILIGDFCNTDEFASYALERFAKSMNIPIFKTNIFGHGYNNMPLVFGEECIISSSGFGFALDIQYDFTTA